MQNIATEIDEAGVYTNYNLERLQKILNYNLSTSALFVLWYFSGLSILLIIVAAIIFSPFILFVLYKEKKSNWIITFGVMVFIPMILVAFFLRSSGYASIGALVVLALVYLFCFVLKFSVNEWIKEERAKEELALKRKLKKEIEDGGGPLHFTKF